MGAEHSRTTFSVSPESLKPESDDEHDVIVMIDAADGSIKPLLAPKGPFASTKWTPDQRIAFIGARVDGPSPHDLYVAASDGSAPRNLTAAALDRPIEAYEFLPDGSALALVQDGFKSALVTVAPNGAVQRRTIPVNARSFAVAANGTIALAGGTATAPPELWLLPPNGAPQLGRAAPAMRRTATMRPAAKPMMS